MLKINVVKELRESKGLTPSMFCNRIESIIDTPDFQFENKLLLRQYDGFTKLRPDYVVRWEEKGRFPEDPVTRQAICLLAHKSIGELLISSKEMAYSILVDEFNSSKSQSAINDIAHLNKCGIVKINLYDNSVSKLMSYIAEVLAITNNLTVTQVDLKKELDSQIDVTKLLNVMQTSCQITTPTTNQLLQNAKISACRYILTQLVRFF